MLDEIMCDEAFSGTKLFCDENSIYWRKCSANFLVGLFMWWVINMLNMQMLNQLRLTEAVVLDFY